MIKKELWLPDLLLYAVLLLAGIALLLNNINHLLVYEPSLRQPTTIGTISNSAIDDKPIRDDAFMPIIEFTYEAEGNVYHKSAIEDEDRVVFFELAELEALLADYPEGIEVPVYYAEGEPETAVIQSGIGTPFNNSRRRMVYIFWDLLLIAFVSYAAIKRNDYRIDHAAGIPYMNPYQRFFAGIMNIHGTPKYDQDE